MYVFITTDFKQSLTLTSGIHFGLGACAVRHLDNVQLLLFGEGIMTICLSEVGNIARGK